jgi:hypothetical protein
MAQDKNRSRLAFRLPLALLAPALQILFQCALWHAGVPAQAATSSFCPFHATSFDSNTTSIYSAPQPVRCPNPCHLFPLALAAAPLQIDVALPDLTATATHAHAVERELSRQRVRGCEHIMLLACIPGNDRATAGPHQHVAGGKPERAGQRRWKALPDGAEPASVPALCD